MRLLVQRLMVLGLALSGTAHAAAMSDVALATLSQSAVQTTLGSGQAENAGDPRPLVLFYVFGWTGKVTSFCDLPMILQNLYNQGGKSRVLSQVLTYDTLNPTATTTDFAKQIYPQILAFFKAHGLSADNPYSLIMHSQGGIVGVKYVELCLHQHLCGHDGDEPAGTPTNLRHFISLAAPFWGSADVGYYDNIRKFVPIPVPPAQTSDLAIASVGLSTDREYLVHADSRSQSFFNPQTQVYAIGGDISDLMDANVVDPIEFDEVVELPNSRLDFNFYYERFAGDPNPQSGARQVTREWKPLLVAHSPLNVFRFHRPGVACVNKADVAPGNPHVHPVYPMLKKWLDRYFGIQDPLAAVASEQASLVKTVLNFSVELKVHLPPGYGARELPFGDQNVLMKVNPSEITRTRHTNTIVAKVHGVHRLTGDLENSLTYYHEGDMSPAFAYRPTLGDDPEVQTAFIDYTIHVPGFLNKTLHLPVNAGRTTFANIYLQPDLPIPPFGLDASDVRQMRDGSVMVALRERSNGQIERWVMNSSDGNLPLTSQLMTSAELTTPEFPLVNRCYVASVAQSSATHVIFVYRDFAGTRAVQQIRPGELLYVLGRMNHAEVVNPQTQQTVWTEDRYLVTSKHMLQLDRVGANDFGPEKGTGWINVSDVDVYPSAKCAF